MKSIRLQALTKNYESKGSGPNAVDAIDLTIEPGEFFFLLGPSGCGKTTLLRMIAGMIIPTSGQIFLGDEDVTHQSVQQRRTAMVFQNYALWPHMTVMQNVEFGPKMQKIDKQKRRDIAKDNLERIQMAEYAERKPNQLSGGQQQRVALARALAAQPSVLLLDEPLSNLDAQLRLQMRAELTSLIKQMGMTAVYVTHDQKEALSMADRIAVMKAGKIIQVGSPLEVYNNPQTRFISEFIGEANLFRGELSQSNDNGHSLVVGKQRVWLNQQQRGMGTVTCCIRPERVEITDSETSTAGKLDHVLTFQATVSKAFYLGEVIQYVCDVEHEDEPWKIITLANRSQRIFSSGSAVQLQIRAEDIALLED